MERECGAIRQRLAVVDETVVVVNTLEHSRVYQLSRAEPPAAHVDPRYLAPRHTLVRYLHRVTRYSVRQRFGCCLVHHNVRPLALLSDPIRLCSRLCLFSFKKKNRGIWVFIVTYTRLRKYDNNVENYWKVYNFLEMLKTQCIKKKTIDWQLPW